MICIAALAKAAIFLYPGALEHALWKGFLPLFYANAVFALILFIWGNWRKREERGVFLSIQLEVLRVTSILHSAALHYWHTDFIWN